MTAPAIVFALYLLGVSGLVGRWPAYAGLAVQVGYLAHRGFSLGRLPLVGVHDTVSFLAAATVAFGIAFGMASGMRSGMAEDRTQRQSRGMVQAVSALAAAFSLMALFQPPFDRPLPPVLKTYWFELHVALSFLSYALFGVAAVAGIFYLKTREPADERLEYKTVFVGYALFSLSMVFGGIWAFLAWGTYWLWTPKELWTALLWLYYGLYLHLRYMKAWQGRPVAVMGVVGYAVVIFTYLGVGLLMKSSHSF